MKKRTSVKNYPWSGNGEKESPYEISSEEHLTTLAEEVNDYGETFECNFFKLTNNIELTDDSWEPIGNRDAMFDGHFDGNGCTISNVVLSGTQSNCGLFAYIGENAVISNFKIFGKMENTKGCSSLGMLVGSNYGTIENCTCETEATITFDVGGSEMYIGFIAGINNAAIEECTVKGTFKFVKKNSAVQGSPIRIGGIVASNYKDASIKQCEVFGEIRTEEDVCGIVYENSGTIKNCTIEQEVLAEIPDDKVLSIVGVNEGTLENNLIKVKFSDENANITVEKGTELQIIR